MEAWRLILQRQDEPAALILSRQALPTLDRSRYASASGLAKGAYILADPQAGKPDVFLLATGSVEDYALLLPSGNPLRKALNRAVLHTVYSAGWKATLQRYMAAEN